MSEGVTDILRANDDAIPDPSVQVVDFTSDRARVIDTRDVGELAGVCTEGSVTWIDIKGYTGDNAPLIEDLGKRLGLHPLAVEDVLHTGQMPKAEDYEDFLFIILRDPARDDDGDVQTAQVNIFVGPTWVLSLHESPHLTDFDLVRERLLAGKSQMRKRNAAHLAHRLADLVIDRYFPVVEQLADKLDSIEDAVESGHESALKDLHDVSREAIQLRRLLRDHRDAVSRLMRFESVLLDEPVRLHLRDVLDHATRLLGEVEEVREVIIGLRELHMSLVNQRMNEVIKLLTIISTIFIPLSFFAGVYGMNFRTDASPTNMPELTAPWGYVAWWIVCLIVGGGMLLWFRRKGWIGGRRDGDDRKEPAAPTTGRHHSAIRRCWFVPALVSLMLIAATGPTAVAQPDDDGDPPAAQPDLDQQLATLRQLTETATQRNAALAAAVDAQRLVADQIVGAFGTRAGETPELASDWWFRNPWQVQLPPDGTDGTGYAQPQDSAFDRTLQEYLQLLEARRQVDELNHWKLENEAALGFVTSRAERLARIREWLRQLQLGQRDVEAAIEQAREAVTAAATARTELLAALPADDPRRQQLPPEVRLDPAVAAREVPVTVPDVDRMLASLRLAMNLLGRLEATLNEQRRLRRRDEDLLQERRLLLLQVLRQRTVDGEAAEVGVDTGPLTGLFIRFEAIADQLSNTRDLLLVARNEMALLEHIHLLLQDENRRLTAPGAERPLPVTPAGTAPYAAVGTLYNAWLKGWREFLAIGQPTAASGPLDTRVNAPDGERILLQRASEAYQRSITGGRADLDDLLERIREDLANVGGPLDDQRAFFQRLAARESERLARARRSRRTIETEQQQVRTELEDLTTRIAELDQQVTALRTATESGTYRERLTARRRADELEQQLAAMRSRQTMLTSRAALSQGAPQEAAAHVQWEEQMLALWQQQIARIDNAIDQRATQQAAERVAAEEQAQRERRDATIRSVVIVTGTILVVVIVGFVLRRIQRGIDAAVDEAMASKRQARVRIQRTQTVFVFVRSITMILIVVAALLVILYAVGVGESLISWLVGSVGVLALAVSFGAQTLIKDFFNGFFILLENQYVQGDWIRIETVEGTVESVGLRTTVLRDLDGVRHVFTNGSISHVANCTARFAYAVLDLGLSYGDNPDEVIPALEDLCTRLLETDDLKDKLMPLVEKPAVLGLQRYDDSAIVYRMRLACRPGQQWQTARIIRRLFFRLCEEKGFTIPFPHHTVYLHDERPSDARADG